MLTNRPLAPTTFVAGPQDDLATPDVYEIQSDSVINNLPIPSAIADVSDITGELRGGQNMLSSLPSLPSINSGSEGVLDKVKSFASTMSKAVGGVSGIKAIASMSGPSLLSRLATGSLSGVPGLNNGALASVASVLRNNNMPPEIKQLFNSPIPSNLGTFSTFGGDMTKLSPTNINQSYQVSSLINNVVNGSGANIVDRDSSVRLLAGLAMGGQSSGMNNTFSFIAPTLAGNDKQILLGAGMAVAKYCATTGNVKGLKDVATTIGANNLKVIGKSLMRTISSGYKPSSDAPQSNATRVSDFNDLSDTLDAIDPGWMREDRMKVDVTTHLPVVDFPVTDISMVQNGSADFKATVLAGATSSSDPEKKWLLSGTMFESTSPEAELKKQFPTTVTNVTANTTADNTTLDQEEKRKLIQQGTVVNTSYVSEEEMVKRLTALRAATIH